MFVRPLTTKVRGEPNILYDKRVTASELIRRVAPGKAVAQEYGIGAPWTDDSRRDFNRTKVCPIGSSCLRTKYGYAAKHFAVGSPYILIKKDFIRLAESWALFSPIVLYIHPHHTSEMYGYSMAAAHERLPHLQLHSYMVSHVRGLAEGWPLVDALEDSCLPPVKGVYFPGVPLPNLVHYCQEYKVAELSFYKRKVSYIFSIILIVILLLFFLFSHRAHLLCSQPLCFRTILIQYIQ